MEFELKAGPQGHIYFPKKIRDLLGEKLKLLPNDHAGAIYPENAEPDQVIASLEIIIDLLRLRQRRETSENEH